LAHAEHSISIDDELQLVIVQTRDYLVAAWNEIASRRRT
jgi:hypothetical protein